jgi:hypothetical protein
MVNLDISPDIAQALGFYVYAYIDPRDESIFYIGKGLGSRATAHLKDSSESKKVTYINELRNAGFEPRIDILSYGLRDDLEASRVEAALIELVGLKNLTNAVKGRFSSIYPRRSLADLILEFKPISAEITDRALLIRINKQFDYGISALELYERTRGVWVIGERRNSARYAMAVYAGIIREVYEIESWHRAGATLYQTRNQKELAKHKHKRWEFIGHVALEGIRSRYLGYSVSHLFKPGLRSPLVGCNLG